MHHPIWLLIVAIASSIATGTAAEAATAFVTSPPSTTFEDPLSVSDSTSFSSASADIPSGAFAVSVTGAPGQTGTSTAGIRGFPNALRFTNNGASSVIVPAGDIHARVVADYVLSHAPGLPGGGSSARCTTALTGAQAGTTHVVHVAHFVSRTFDANGVVTGSSNNFVPTPGAGSVTAADTSIGHLDVTLALPEFEIQPGEWLDLSFSVQVNGASTTGIGAADCGTAELRFLVPAGASLDDDSGASLPWVVSTPAVPALGPAGGALLGALLMGAGWRRRR